MRLQLYAYTQSALQRGVLDLFVRCEAVLPNLYIGTLTRDSVLGALRKGLDAEQLMTFLRRHAHPRSLQRSPVVPEVSASAITMSNVWGMPCFGPSILTAAKCAVKTMQMEPLGLTQLCDAALLGLLHNMRISHSDAVIMLSSDLRAVIGVGSHAHHSNLL